MLNQVFDQLDYSSRLWRPLVRFPDYEVSSLGDVRRATPGRATFRGRVLRQTPNSNGYRTVHLRDVAGRSQSVLVHVLVAGTFLPAREDDQEVNHIDGCKHHNSIENLEWASRSENHRHAYATGLRSANDHRGEKNPRAKISDVQATEIKLLVAEGANVWDLSWMYGLSVITVRQIARGRRRQSIS